MWRAVGGGCSGGVRGRGREMNREGEGENAGEGVDIHFHAVQCSVV